MSDPDVADDALPPARQWWLGTARLRAETVVSLPELGEDAFAVLDAAFPRSFDNNRLLLPTVPRTLTPSTVVDVADEVLGGAGLPHRQVIIFDAVPSRWLDELVAATGATASRSRLMALRPDSGGSGLSGTTTGTAVEVDEARARLFVEADWRESEPGFDDTTVRQLVGRRVRYERAGRPSSYGVESTDPAAPAGLVALADLLVRGRRAGIDSVGTLLAFRGAGHGTAVVTAAVLAARRAGCAEVLLDADDDDWPAGWYERLGFVVVGESWTFDWTAPA